MPANAPASPARSIVMTGTIVTKMPAKSFATSSIGAQLNCVARARARGVSASDSKRHGHEQHVAHAFCNATCVPNTSNVDARFPEPAHQHEADHGGEQQKVDLAVDAERRRVGRRIEKRDCAPLPCAWK